MSYTPRWRRFISVTALVSATFVGTSTLATVPTAFAAETLTIAEIQGTGETSPVASKEVTTTGIVTAVYATGGLNGYFIQTEGSASLDFTPGASDGVFIYSPDTASSVTHGDLVTVTGTVSEYKGQTQISVKNGGLTILSSGHSLPAITGVLPEDASAREALEGMLVQPTGSITVTDNYGANRYGSFSLVNGEKPLRTATDVVAPGAAAIEYEAANKAKAYVLDDGSTADYTRGGSSTPVPYIGTATPLRVGASATFAKPVIMSFSFGAWTLQPTAPVSGKTADSDLPVSWTNTREAAPDAVGGELSISSFNVLNYFSTTGDELTGCKYYTDREKNPITVSGGCDARGAANQENFERQQAKIVAAINTLDASVISLEEIENSAVFGKDRDEALNTLVAALNAAAGSEKWAAVASPEKLPSSEDVIRTAFIYQPTEATPVGESEILTDTAAFNNARKPLAQAFKASTADDNDEIFVAIVNHFKSKGSGSGVNADSGDGQGASNASRVAQATDLVKFAEAQEAKHKTQNVVLLGDFNAYTQEDPMQVLYKAGYVSLDTTFDAGHTYLYGGRTGSLDHVLASGDFIDNFTDADVWNINSVESIGLEYSRFNNNVTNLYAPNAYRSSDHDPLIAGFNLSKENPAPLVFTDVVEGDQFYTEIMWLAQRGITAGWADGTFRPVMGVDRATMAAFFYRLAGSPKFDAPATPSFSDVPVDHQFYTEIEWFYAQGITTGWGEGTFRPDAPVNRNSMAAFFYRCTGSPLYVAPVNSSFVDLPERAPFYKEISWLRAQGITTGWADGTYRPYQPIERAAMAAFIYRYSDNVLNEF
ncbi:ExeM/NucH family extracellular endonuclease [Rothia sp. ZJ1223]|uniref:ExeM/NucH family extracellular endonuclease n=1 Tax=Rothia sp. ZJ1223 TaxID=2811098 RepID=UPI001EF4DDFE|nr:ExeM/NucH family extracellular endonuclease [Rothia sp. ZJ1223]